MVTGPWSQVLDPFETLGMGRLETLKSLALEILALAMEGLGPALELLLTERMEASRVPAGSGEWLSTGGLALRTWRHSRELKNTGELWSTVKWQRAGGKEELGRTRVLFLADKGLMARGVLQKRELLSSSSTTKVKGRISNSGWWFPGWHTGNDANP